MKEINNSELKEIQLELLKDVHSFCICNDIKYSLAYGTLLGAVRHHGYIPWDDDIDIMMPREDYDRFIRSYGNNVYKIADMSVNPEYGLPYAKVEDTRTLMKEMAQFNFAYGVYLDIFPVDYVPEEISVRKLFYRRKSFWNVLFNLKTIKVNRERSLIKNIILMMAHILLSIISVQSIARRMLRMATKYQDQKTSYMGIVAPADSRIEEAIPSSYFEEYVELPFENTNVMSIKEYAIYLTASYGDYMQLPPVEQRVSHHVFYAYWK